MSIEQPPETPTTGAATRPPCPICQKHRGRGSLTGPVIHSDTLIEITHRADGPLGYVFIETKRHVASLGQLTEEEAMVIGQARSRLARGLRTELEVEHVHAFVAGLGIPHFHEHLFARHLGTPHDHPWWQQWEGGVRGDVADFAARLRTYFDEIDRPA
jgi:diadenosine tetraphosphate (Ap4A) HIT family hydrolase